MTDKASDMKVGSFSAAADDTDVKEYLPRSAKAPIGGTPRGMNARASDGLFRQNVVLMSGILTGPVVAGATDFEHAAVISLAFTLITLLTVSVCRFFPRRIVYTVRIILYAVTASLVYIPVYLLLRELMGLSVLANAGVYIPVLVTNPLILSKTETRFYLRPYKFMLPETLGYIAGFDAVCLLTGVLRDILVNSRVGWINFGLGFNIPALETSFGGFILVGVMAGLCRAIYSRARRKG